jgi:DNA-binding NtrC family response regulator
MLIPSMDGRYSCVPDREIPSEGTGVVTQRMPDASGERPQRLVLSLRNRDVVVDRSLSIGQDDTNDVVIDDACVSRRHCRIEVMGERVMVRDLQSTNGTFLNGVRIATAELRRGARLSVGGVRIAVGVAEAESPLLGDSRVMRQLRDDIVRFAPTDMSVLINGETGTGKELVARALHELSGRRGHFVPLNCGSIPEGLAESELFGHERGAFTGAAGRRQGVFEAADGGTLFLDEVGELPIELQPRLLRVLECGVVRPVGASREMSVDVRVVAATHVDLQAAVEYGKFRRDLYFRLAGAVLATPPVRARAEDVAVIAERYLRELSSQLGPSRLSEAALEALREHRWPGNVRELKNVLKRAALLGGSVIEPEHLALEGGVARPDLFEVVRVDGRSYLEIEREVLARTLKKYAGNQAQAAMALQIPKSTMCDKVRRYAIDLEEEEPRPIAARSARSGKRRW